MLRTIILVKEESCRNILQAALKDGCSENVELIESVGSVDKAVAAIREHQPDLVFIDVMLTSQSCKDLIKQLGKIYFDIIFVTPANRYLECVSELSGHHLLTKPVKMEEVKWTVEQAELRIKEKLLMISLNALLHIFNPARTNKIPIHKKDGFEMKSLSDVLYIQSSSNRTYVFFKNDPEITPGKRPIPPVLSLPGRAKISPTYTYIVSNKSLNYYEALFKEFGFLKSHKSYLVNKNEVSYYLTAEPGVITMSDGEKVPISRRFKDAFLSEFV